MFDFLLINTETKLLIGFLLLCSVIFLLVKNEYIKNKVLGWSYIIILFIISFNIPYGSLLFIAIISILSIIEGKKLLNFGIIRNIIYSMIFLILISGLGYFIFSDIKRFFYIFILISFSDIVAYTVGKNIVWKKGFTKLSPNKTLSGVLGQIIFLGISLYYILDYNFAISIIAGILAPIGDLTESYFKRNSNIKDTADYIPGHGGVLDRIDSSLLTVNFILLINFVIGYFQI